MTGTPQLELDFNGTANTADYSSTDGDEVVFSYTVALNYSDDSGIAVGADKLSLNGGTVKDGSDSDATLTQVDVAADSGHKVDGSDTTAPTISSVAITSDPVNDDTYGIGDGIGDAIEVTVTFSEDITITDTPQLDFDGTAKTADYGSAISANKLSLNGGTIQDRRQTHHLDPRCRGRRFWAQDGQFGHHRAYHLVHLNHKRSRQRQHLRHRRHHTGNSDLQRGRDGHRHATSGTQHVRSDPSARQASYSCTKRANVVFAFIVVGGGSASDGLEIQAQADPQRRHHPGRCRQRRDADAFGPFCRPRSLREWRRRRVIHPVGSELHRCEFDLAGTEIRASNFGNIPW